MRFRNGSSKVAIELRVVQFWSEIILVISNRTRAACSFDFEVTRMISDQIALHSVQLPLLIGQCTRHACNWTVRVILRALLRCTLLSKLNCYDFQHS